MGDHRATVKVEFDIHGKVYKQEWWINYFPDDSSGVDRRIAEWFSACWEDAYSRYQKVVNESHREEDERKQREAELAELKRLKEKYEGAAPTAQG